MINKRSATLPITLELLSPLSRLPKSKRWVEPTQAELDAYEEWFKRYDAAANEGFSKGFLEKGYEGTYITPPRARWEYEYAGNE